MIEHIETHIGDEHIKKNSKNNQQNQTRVQGLLSCNLCEYNTKFQPELDSHVKRIHSGNLSSSSKTTIEEHPVEETASVTEGEELMCESIAVCGMCQEIYN